VFKRASKFGASEFDKFVVNESRDNDAIRSNEDLEKIAFFDDLLGSYPAFVNCAEQFGRERTHWLLVHKLQMDRLKKLGVRIPSARFVFLIKRRLLLKPSVSIFPALVQRRIRGISMGDMIDHGALARDIASGRKDWLSYVKVRYQVLLPAIESQLHRVMDEQGQARDHINWYIRNFIYEIPSGDVYYIDEKPSNLFGRARNEQNFEALHRDLRAASLQDAEEFRRVR
jgi:hypothetical protein